VTSSTGGGGGASVYSQISILAGGIPKLKLFEIRNPKNFDVVNKGSTHVLAGFQISDGEELEIFRSPKDCDVITMRGTIAYSQIF